MKLRNWILDDYFRKWVVLGVLIGVVAGLGAIVFYVAIDKSTWLFLGQIVGWAPPGPRGEGDTIVTHPARRWLLPFVVGLGGLISGLIVFTLAPEAEGHGTDAAIDAFHQKGGRIRSRIPFIKLVASAVTIGSGGSAGREGPTAQIAAGFGSWLGGVLHLSASDRRTALAVGVGAGIGAIFKAPLGGAILSAEILYIRDFEIEALIPGFIASVVGYSIFGAVYGWSPVFGAGLGLKFDDPATLPWFALLGLVCGVVGIAYVRMFYGMRDAFHRIPVPPHIKPAIAGVLVGGIGIVFPQVLSMGYGWLQLAIEGNTAELAVSTMLVLVVLKIVATSLTIGSGGSGGVFAPGLFIGGMVGGGMWGVLHGHVGGLPNTPAPFVIVGMMALFGGVAKAPIAVILMVAEMTNEFSMTIPAMMAVTISYLVTNQTRIYESQVESRAQSPAHRGEYIIPLLQAVSVADAMRIDVDTAAPDDGVEESLERLAKSGRRGLPVLEGGVVVGMFTLSDGLRAQHEGKMKVREVMATSLLVAHPADSLHSALRRMTDANISRLPVVNRSKRDQLVGIVSTRDIAAALDSQFAELVNNDTKVGFSETRDLLAEIPVREAMTQEFDAFPESTPAALVVERLNATLGHAALLLDDAGHLTGIATLPELEKAVAAADNGFAAEIAAGRAATRVVVVARASQSISEALAQPGASGIRQLPVVEGSRNGIRPVGLLRRTDVLAAYLRARDRQATIARRRNRRPDSAHDELVDVEFEITVKDGLAGRTLSEIGMPQEAIITSIVRNGRDIVPRGAVRLEPGDNLRITTSSGARDHLLTQLTSERVAD